MASILGFLAVPKLTKLQGFDVSRFLVSARDDGDPAFTFRSILLGTVFTALSSVITMMYVFKSVQMQVSAVFIQRKHTHQSSETELLAHSSDSVGLRIWRSLG